MILKNRVKMGSVSSVVIIIRFQISGVRNQVPVDYKQLPIAGFLLSVAGF